VNVFPGNGRHVEELRSNDGHISVDPLGNCDQLFHVFFRKGAPEVMQRDEAMFDSGMVEEHQEGFEEEFTDR
jgi:hypothetical protein